MFKMIFISSFILTLSACQSAPSIEDRPLTAKEVAKAAKASQTKAEQKENAPNPVRCQQAKLNLVEAEGTQDVGQINFAKDAVHRHCDNFE